MSRVLKQKLFEIGVNAMAQYLDSPDQIYVCPLCLVGFFLKDIDKLTFEHVPQKSIGGSRLCLTCTKCNSGAGEDIDSHLHRRERVHSFIRAIGGQETYTGRVRVTTNDITTNAKLVLKNGTANFTIPSIINHPDSHKSFFSGLKNMTKSGNWEGRTTNVELIIDRHNPKKAMIADLKSAYLAAFALLGYGYIFREEVQLIRQQISEPNKEIIVGYSYLKPQIEMPSNLSIIDLEKPFDALVVNIYDRHIFLPPVEPKKDFYKFLEVKSKVKYEGRQIHFPKTMKMLFDKI